MTLETLAGKVIEAAESAAVEFMVVGADFRDDLSFPTHKTDACDQSEGKGETGRRVRVLME